MFIALYQFVDILNVVHALNWGEKNSLHALTHVL